MLGRTQLCRAIFDHLFAIMAVWRNILSTKLIFRELLTKNATSCGLHTTAVAPAKVAVVLSGCGVYDGSEIHEASACMVHLSWAKADVAVFAPDISQLHVVNHVTGAPVEGETRNVLVESARIARGKISPLSELKASGFDAVVFPGGFGAAKNLSTFAVDGVKMTVNDDVERVLKDFHSSKKPIGMCCISPVLAAKVLPGCELTVGHDSEEGGRYPYAATAVAIKQLRAKHINKTVTEFHVDEKNRVVTTPAFMSESPLHEIFDGIGAMVTNLLKLVKN